MDACDEKTHELLPVQNMPKETEHVHKHQNSNGLEIIKHMYETDNGDEGEDKISVPQGMELAIVELDIHGNAGNAFPSEHPLTLSGRDKRWIIRYLPRNAGTRDYATYIHLETDKMFRSWREVIAFIVHNKVPGRQATGSHRATAESKDKSGRVTAEKLVRLFVVGYYNVLTEEKFWTRERTLIRNNRRRKGKNDLIGEVPPGYTHVVYDVEPLELLG